MGVYRSFVCLFYWGHFDTYLYGDTSTYGVNVCSNNVVGGRVFPAIIHPEGEETYL